VVRPDARAAAAPAAAAAGTLAAAAATGTLEGRTRRLVARRARRAALMAVAGLGLAVVAVRLGLVLAPMGLGRAFRPFRLAGRLGHGRGGGAQVAVVAAVEGRDALARDLLDVLQEIPFVVGAERHGRAVGPGPGRPAD